MKEGWQFVKLGTLIKRIKGGGTPSKSKPEYWNGDIPWCSVKDMSDDKFKIDSTQDSITQLGLNNSSSNLIEKNTVVTATRMGLGRAFLTGVEMAINQDLKAIYPKKELDNDFLLWLLIVNRKNLENLGSGATVKGIRLEVLKAINVLCPPLPTQRKIAGILSAYDDLIENNLKRIKLLEEKAQLMYQEWFVRLRFPGHQNTPINPETGLPQGWEKVKLGEMCSLTMGQSPKSEFYNDVGEGLPFHQGVKDYGDRFPSNNTWSTEGSRIAPENSVLFSVRAPVGRLNIAIEEIILGRGLAAINHKDGKNSFLFYQLKNQFYADNLMGGGAIYNSVTKKDMENIKLIKPSADLLFEFEKSATNCDLAIKNLFQQNQLLKEARDILLPRLMTGVIDVDQFENVIM